MTTNPEDLFPPVKGGMVDTARQKMAADQAQAMTVPAAAGDAGEYPAVRVRDELPDLGIARTITLSASNTSALLLPRDDQRRSAIVLAVDNDVWISYNEGAVQDLSGTSGAGGAFYLPAGIAIPVLSTAAVFVSPTTTATSSRISVMTGRDSG